MSRRYTSKDFYNQYDITQDRWSKGLSKTLDNYLDMINADSELIPDEDNGALLRFLINYNEENNSLIYITPIWFKELNNLNVEDYLDNEELADKDLLPILLNPILFKENPLNFDLNFTLNIYRFFENDNEVRKHLKNTKKINRLLKKYYNRELQGNITRQDIEDIRDIILYNSKDKTKFNTTNKMEQLLNYLQVDSDKDYDYDYEQDEIEKINNKFKKEDDLKLLVKSLDKEKLTILKNLIDNALKY